jgi:glycosyltransferase involved in cell wall biosynthesis
MTARWSVVMPVHDPPLHLLRAALASVRDQTVNDWELCVVDDGSSTRWAGSELATTVPRTTT